MTNYDPNDPRVVYWKFMMVLVVCIATVLVAIILGAYVYNVYAWRAIVDGGLEQRVISPPGFGSHQETIWVKSEAASARKE